MKGINNMLNEIIALKKKREMLGDKTVVIYCDMDGVLAKWDKACNIETIFAKDYFFNLLLEPAVKDALLLLHDAGFNVSILSAAAAEGYARGDKTRWREKFGMGHLPYIYTISNENKADFIETKPDGTYILLDDYNPNLLAWAATQKDGNFVAVKFLNGINGGSDVWQGRTLYHRSDGITMAHTLADMAIMAAIAK